MIQMEQGHMLTHPLKAGSLGEWRMPAASAGASNSLALITAGCSE